MAKPTVTPFRSRLAATDESALRAERLDTLLVNVGLSCDLECAHCHLSCGPDRPEIMGRETMDAVVRFASAAAPDLVDVTGGAPELHPDIEGFLAALRAQGLAVQMRANLTALSSRTDLLESLVDMGVGLLASLPIPEADDDPRGVAWERCVDVLEDLSRLGYGEKDPLPLDVAVTTIQPPTCDDVEEIERRLRERLEPRGVRFRQLALITCVPVGRFAEGLGPEGVDAYLRFLATEFEPSTVALLGCRHGIEVAWDGTLWDCDFNLGAGLAPPAGLRHMDEVDVDTLGTRPIAFGEHCYACTAAAGSS